MDETAASLRSAFVEAYPIHVRQRLETRGWVVDDSVISAGARWLDDALGELLERPLAEQRRGPLEVFQEAMRAPTEALTAAGVAEPERDPVAVAALPGDRYDLAPASSADLPEQAWRAHLAWGAAKAAAVRPAVVVVTRNLMDRERIAAAVQRSGFVTADIDAERPAAYAFVDLEHPEADGAIQSLSAGGVRVVAFGPHVDDLAMTRARTLGATEAVPRSRFFKDPGAWLQPLV